MCGRFNLAGLSWSELWHLMNDGTPPPGWDASRNVQIPQSYNIAPTQDVPFVRLLRDKAGELTGELARWGLIPNWFKKPIKEWKANTINARVESAAEAPSYRDAYRNGRCIVPMKGYYEWSTLTATKRAYYIQHSSEAGLLVAGLWSEVRLPDFTGATCAILTEEATDQLATIHDRKPVLLSREAARMWLDGRAIEDIPRLPVDQLTMKRVSGKVGSWKAQGPDLIKPVEEDDEAGV
jgi:putative SOS response-associated peptidase YedK